MKPDIIGVFCAFLQAGFIFLALFLYKYLSPPEGAWAIALFIAMVLAIKGFDIIIMRKLKGNRRVYLISLYTILIAYLISLFGKGIIEIFK